MRTKGMTKKKTMTEGTWRTRRSWISPLGTTFSTAWKPMGSWRRTALIPLRYGQRKVYRFLMTQMMDRFISSLLRRHSHHSKYSHGISWRHVEINIVNFKSCFRRVSPEAIILPCRFQIRNAGTTDPFGWTLASFFAAGRSSKASALLILSKRLRDNSSGVMV
jgi:hypothetical protein